MLYIVVAIIMFSLLIAVHEFGHFFTAKLFGIRVNEFAIGMGPAILKRKREKPFTAFVFSPWAVFVPWRARMKIPTIPVPLAGRRPGSRPLCWWQAQP